MVLTKRFWAKSNMRFCLRTRLKGVRVVKLVLLVEGGRAHLEVLAGERFLDLEQSQELLLQANGARHVLGFFGFVEPVDLLELPVQVAEENPVLSGMADGVQQSGLV